MGTDFRDNDLLQPETRRRETVDSRNTDMILPLTDTNIGRMAKQKEETAGHVATAVKEIEQLRMKQEELEKEKNRLQELSRKQDEYEQGKRDILEKLDRGIITVEREEVEATRMVELLSETRNKFKNLQTEIRNINEDSWTDESFLVELNKALAIVENARMDYKKGLARIDASSWHKAVGKDHSELMEGMPGVVGGGGFGHWLKVGFAASLPVTAVVIIFLVLYVLRMFNVI